MSAKLLTGLQQQTLGALALFVALGGTSYAVATGSIDSREIKNNTIRSNDVRDRALTSRDIGRSTLGQLRGAQGRPGAPGPMGPAGPAGLPATKLFAKVAAAGELQYGSGATGVSREAPGDYEVTFNRDLSRCVAVAQVGFGNPSTPGDQLFSGTTTTTSIVARSVWVAIERPTGAPADSSFHLAVFC